MSLLEKDTVSILYQHMLSFNKDILPFHCCAHCQSQVLDREACTLWQLEGRGEFFRLAMLRKETVNTISKQGRILLQSLSVLGT